MKYFFIILTLLLTTTLVAQQRFDPLHVKRLLMELPVEWEEVNPDKDIIQAIQAVDRKYREISDTLYTYKSRTYTIFQAILIDGDSGTIINPLNFGNKLKLKNIIFENHLLRDNLDSVAHKLNSAEKEKLYTYLETHFDSFDEHEKRLKAQPVRIRTINFPDKRYVHVGIDIYGRHLLWVIDRAKNWDVISVKTLWVY